MNSQDQEERLVSQASVSQIGMARSKPITSDDDLLSGRLNNNLGPVIFQNKPIGDDLFIKPQKSEFGGVGVATDSIQSPNKVENAGDSKFPEIPDNTSRSHLSGRSQSILDLNFQGQNRFGGVLMPQPSVSKENSQVFNQKSPFQIQKQQNSQVQIENETPQIGQVKIEQSKFKLSTVPSHVVVQRHNPQRTHKEIMEQIETTNNPKKPSRSNSRQSQKEFRSPSAFMAYAEQAAEAFAKYALNSEGQQNVAHGSTYSPSIVGGQDMSTPDKRSPGPIKSTKTGEKDRRYGTGQESMDESLVRLQQLTERSQEEKQNVIQFRRKRVSTAASPNIRNYETKPQASYNFQRKVKDNKGVNTLIMSQTQQNLNKLRMSRKTQSNLMMMSQRTNYMNRNSSVSFGISGQHLNSNEDERVQTQSRLANRNQNLGKRATSGDYGSSKNAKILTQAGATTEDGRQNSKGIESSPKGSGPEDIFSQDKNFKHPPVPRLNLDRNNTVEGDMLAGQPQKLANGKEINYQSVTNLNRGKSGNMSRDAFSRTNSRGGYGSRPRQRYAQSQEQKYRKHKRNRTGVPPYGQGQNQNIMFRDQGSIIFRGSKDLGGSISNEMANFDQNQVLVFNQTQKSGNMFSQPQQSGASLIIQSASSNERADQSKANVFHSVGQSLKGTTSSRKHHSNQYQLPKLGHQMKPASIPVNVNINVKGASIENPNSGAMNPLDTTVQSNMLDNSQSYMQKESDATPQGQTPNRKLKNKANLDIKSSLAQDPSAVIQQDINNRSIKINKLKDILNKGSQEDQFELQNRNQIRKQNPNISLARQSSHAIKVDQQGHDDIKLDLMIAESAGENEDTKRFVKSGQNESKQSKSTIVSARHHQNKNYLPMQQLQLIDVRVDTDASLGLKISNQPTMNHSSSEQKYQKQKQFMSHRQRRLNERNSSKNTRNLGIPMSLKKRAVSKDKISSPLSNLFKIGKSQNQQNMVITDQAQTKQDSQNYNSGNMPNIEQALDNTNQGTQTYQSRSPTVVMPKNSPYIKSQKYNQEKNHQLYNTGQLLSEAQKRLIKKTQKAHSIVTRNIPDNVRRSNTSANLHRDQKEFSKSNAIHDRKTSAKSVANKTRSGQWQINHKQGAMQMFTTGAKVELQKHTTSGELKRINSDLDDKKGMRPIKVDQETETGQANQVVETQIGSEEKHDQKTTVYKKNKNDTKQSPGHTVSRNIEDDGPGNESERDAHVIQISKINQPEDETEQQTPFNISARPQVMENQPQTQNVQIQDHSQDKNIESRNVESLLKIPSSPLSPPANNKNMGKLPLNDRQSSETRTVDNGPGTLCSFDDKMMSSNRRNQLESDITHPSVIGHTKSHLTDKQQNPSKLSQRDSQTKISSKSGLKSNKSQKQKVGFHPKDSSRSTTVDPNCPLTSVLEKEELNIFQFQKMRQDQIDQRKRERELFFERQKDLAERKSSNCHQPKKKIMISDDLMKSPLQKIGRVSTISKRQEATMNEKYAHYRDDMLNNKKSEREIRASKHKPDKPIDYDAMPIGQRLLKKMHKQYNERQKDKASKASLAAKQAKMRGIVNDSKVSSQDCPDEFKTHLIQTKEDEIVFTRINPHLPEYKTKINLPDQSLYDLLKKNGGIPLYKKEEQMKAAPQIPKGEIPVHEMNDFQKQTFDFIHKLRRDMKAENLQATLVQYIKQNKDEEMLNNFCRDLLQSQAALKAEKERMARIQEIQLKKWDRSNSPPKRSPNRKGELSPKGKSQVLDMNGSPQSPHLTAAQRIEREIKQMTPETRKRMFLKKSSKQLDLYMINEYLRIKEYKLEMQKKKELENEKFEAVSKQQKGTRFCLTKQERERVLQKLEEIGKYEELREKYLQEHMANFRQARLEKQQNNDIKWLVKQREEKRIQSIKDHILERQQKRQNTQQDKSSVASKDYDCFTMGENPVPKEEAVQIEINLIDFQNLKEDQQDTDKSDQGMSEKQQKDLMDNFDQMIDNIKIEIGEISFNEETEDLYLQQVIDRERMKQKSDKQTQGQQIDSKEQENNNQKTNADINNIIASSNSINRGNLNIQVNQDAPITPGRDNQVVMLVDTKKDDDQFFKNYVADYNHKQRELDIQFGKIKIDSPPKVNEKTTSSIAQSPVRSNQSPLPYGASQKSKDVTSEQDDEAYQGTVNSQNVKLDLKVDAMIIEEEKISDVESPKSGSSVSSCSELKLEEAKNSMKKDSQIGSRSRQLGKSRIKMHMTYSGDEGLSVLERNAITVHNEKLLETTKANVNLLKNIQRQKFNQMSKWGLKTSTTTMNLHQKKLQAERNKFKKQRGLSHQNISTKQNLETQNKHKNHKQEKLSLFNIARSCQEELGQKRHTSFSQKGSRLFKNYDKKMTQINDQSNKMIQDLRQLKNNVERVRLNEENDDYEDILLDDIQNERQLLENDEKDQAKVAKGEMQGQKHIKEFLRDRMVVLVEAQNS